MIKAIGGKVWHTKYSFNKSESIAVLYYADDLVIAANKKWW